MLNSVKVQSQIVIDFSLNLRQLCLDIPFNSFRYQPNQPIANLY